MFSCAHFCACRFCTIVAGTLDTSTLSLDENADDFEGGHFPAAARLIFSSGDSEKTITFNIQGDTEVEPDESFFVGLSNPSAGAIIGVRSSTFGRIRNDDGIPGLTLSKTSVSVSESETTDTFTVKLNTQPTSDVVLSVASDDTGEATVSTASLTFTPSELGHVSDGDGDRTTR